MKSMKGDLCLTLTLASDQHQLLLVRDACRKVIELLATR
jgi:hypothetical protein